MKIIKKFGLLSMMFLFLFNVNSKAETWRIQAHLPSGHTVYQFIDDWVKEVNTMLGGRLTLELYPAKAIIPIPLIIIPKGLAESKSPTITPIVEKIIADKMIKQK